MIRTQLTNCTFAAAVLAVPVVAVTACHHPGVSGSPIAASAPHVAPGDWPAFNRTLAGDRFSPLAEIERTNVSRLGVVCSYKLPEVTALQTGPIVVGGTMYFTTDTISYAINAGTCKGWLTAFDADNGNVLWKVATEQSMGGGIVSYSAGGRQLIGVAAGMKSPIWPGGAAASQIVVYGLR